MREDKIHKLEVHVAGVCIQGDTVFALKRAPTRRLYPQFWECGGGQVWKGENFEEALVRQFREESGILIRLLRPFKTYEILMDDQEKIPGLRFLCELIRYENGKGPVFSEEHTECRWQPLDRLNELSFIPGLEGDIREAYDIYKNLK